MGEELVLVSSGCAALAGSDSYESIEPRRATVVVPLDACLRGALLGRLVLSRGLAGGEPTEGVHVGMLQSLNVRSRSCGRARLTRGPRRRLGADGAMIPSMAL